ncbi:MAG: hypothetical protein HYW91_01140 [Candidatus Sungbacteria bacterium]|nr:hypothetical protein [Candidatus Sungbacteria bacterium]
MADLLLKKESPLQTLQMRRGGSILFYFSLLAFFLASAGYGGLWLLNNAQGKARDELIAQVKTKEEELRPELLNQIFLLDARLKSMRALLSQHSFPSNILNFLETHTHPRVRFLNFNFSGSAGKLDMTGEAASYAVLAEQIALLEGDPNIETVEFGGLSIGAKNLANFKMAIIFKPSILHLRP